MKSNHYSGKISNKQIERTVKLLKAISEGNRIRILLLLKGGKRCVCEIWPALDLPQNLISHHLSVLKTLRLVKTSKQGQKVFYELNDNVFKHDLNNLISFLTPPL